MNEKKKTSYQLRSEKNKITATTWLHGGTPPVNKYLI